MTRVLLNFRAGFAGLREGFEALGCEVIENQWTPGGAVLEGMALCVADFVDCARSVRRSLGLKRRLERARVPFIALNRDAPFNRGVHPARLAALRLLKPFDAYASHSMQEADRFARRVLYCPNAARESVYRVSEADLAAMRDPAQYRWDVTFFGNLDAARYGEHARRVAFLRALEPRLQDLGISASFRDRTIGGGAGRNHPEKPDQSFYIRGLRRGPRTELGTARALLRRARLRRISAFGPAAARRGRLRRRRARGVRRSGRWRAQDPHLPGALPRGACHRRARARARGPRPRLPEPRRPAARLRAPCWMT
jgi:hypothetical protein